ncbi:MAG: hypothetical protein ACOC0J_00990 [Myxococcota bacterium]
MQGNVSQDSATTPETAPAAEEQGSAPPAQGQDAPPAAPEAAPAPEAGEQSTETPTPQEFSLAFPEDVQVDDSLVSGFTDWAKEHGIEGQAAQKMADLFIGRQKELAAEAEKAAQEQRQTFLDQIKSDPEMGRDLEATKAVCKRALVQFGDETIQKLFDEGVDNLDVHPGVARLLFRVGKALGEDSMGGQERPTKQPDQRELNKMAFPNSPELW